jgi:hypothetical protein
MAILKNKKIPRSISELNLESFYSSEDPIKDKGAIIARINATIYYWNILYIDVLFVLVPVRGVEPPTY